MDAIIGMLGCIGLMGLIVFVFYGTTSGLLVGLPLLGLVWWRIATLGEQ